MTIFQALILSIVEGFTEFIPVSSTGHLILASHLLKIPQTDFLKSFEIIIQLGAILAVVFLYWQKLIRNQNLWLKIFIAFLPSAIFGFLFYKFIKLNLLGNSQVVLWSLFSGGIVLILVEAIFKKNETFLRNLSDSSNLKSLSYRSSFFIGLFQTLSLIPGVSRSAATIVGGLVRGLNRREAVEFSFFLAIPTMFAASSYDILKNHKVILNGSLLILFIGFLGSFLTALLAIKFFLRFVENHTFIPFALYRILLAILFFFFL